jgi:hypothetical protein
VKRLSALVVLSLVVLSLLVSPALAAPGDKVPNDPPNATTLDACGFFVGIETPTQTKEYTEGGVTYRSEKGKWTGVTNNYGNGPVASLGDVKGTYRLETATGADGIIRGTESFHSSAGKIDQTFVLNFAVGSFDVTVVATKELSFLTSDTDGQCYAGQFPRP